MLRSFEVGNDAERQLVLLVDGHHPDAAERVAGIDALSIRWICRRIQR
jgi:hypothetical protein